MPILGKRKNYSKYYGTSLGSRRWKRRRLNTYPRRYAMTPYRYRRKQNIPRYITPDTKLVKLKYHFAHKINPGGGATTWMPVAANDVYAPTDSSFSGFHQPMGFDQCMQLYERWCVVGSKIHMVIAPDTQVDNKKNARCIYGIAVRDTTTPESVQDPTGTQTNEGLLERNRTLWKYGTNGESTPLSQIGMKFSTKKFFKQSSVNETGNDPSGTTLWGTASASPTKKAYFNCFAAPVDYDGDTNIVYRITVFYTVLLSGRKLLGQS